MKNQIDQTKERREKLEKKFSKLDWNVLHNSLIEHVIENENDLIDKRPSSVVSIQKEKVKFQTVKDDKDG